MSWHCLQQNPGLQQWLWWPGWSFSPQVFEDLYQQLPGQHYAMSYPSEAVSVDEFLQHLITTLPASGLWVGWSLGGALACQAALLTAQQQSQIQPKHLVTLATGRQFVGPGMPASDYQAFAENLAQHPQRTAQRFLALACRGARDARQRARQLAHYQLSDAAILQHTLPWLEHAALTDVAAAEHWCGANDALQPTGFDYQTYGSSHALFAGEDHPTLLQRLQQLAEAVHDTR